MDVKNPVPTEVIVFADTIFYTEVTKGGGIIEHYNAGEYDVIALLVDSISGLETVY